MAEQPLYNETHQNRSAAPTAYESLLGDAIERAFAAGGAVVPQRIAIEPSVKPIGHGTSGMTAQVHLGYNVGTITAPTDVIAKFGRTSGVSPGISPGERELRTYQRQGLAWLQCLREAGFNGILADDMGLGKTVQTLAHLVAEKEAGRADRPSLVVAPTSLLPNWSLEAARFAPGLRVGLWHGGARSERA